MEVIQNLLIAIVLNNMM